MSGKPLGPGSDRVCGELVRKRLRRYTKTTKRKASRMVTLESNMTQIDRGGRVA
jgi:hypothetical protein